MHLYLVPYLFRLGVRRHGYGKFAVVQFVRWIGLSQCISLFLVLFYDGLVFLLFFCCHMLILPSGMVIGDNYIVLVLKDEL